MGVGHDVMGGGNDVMGGGNDVMGGEIYDVMGGEIYDVMGAGMRWTEDANCRGGCGQRMEWLRRLYSIMRLWDSSSLTHLFEA